MTAIAKRREWDDIPIKFHIWTGIGLVAVVGFYVLSNRLFFATPEQRQLFTLVGQLTISLTGIHLCFTGPKPEKRDLSSRAPLLLALVSIINALSALSCFAESSLLRYVSPTAQGFPGIVRRFFTQHLMDVRPNEVLLALSPLMLCAALLLWPTRPIPRLALPKILNDALVFYFGLGALAWVFIMGPIFERSTLSPYGTVMTALSPMYDLLMIVLLVMAVWRGVPPAMRPATWLIATAIVALSFGDAVYTTRKFSNLLILGTPIDVMWPFACVVCNMAGGWLRFSLAAWPEQKGTGKDPFMGQGVGRWMQVAPTLFVPVCVGLIAYALSDGPSHFVQNGLYVFIFLFLATVIAHQLLAIRENNSLYDNLNLAFTEVRKHRTKLEAQYQELEEANSRLAKLAHIDGLTGLWNHRAFHEELEKAQRELPAPLAILLIDVDFFKQYNDEFGHPAGDKTLKDVGRAIREGLPDDAFEAKFGGDEFAVLLRGDSALEVAMVADQVRATVAGCQVDHRPVTVSVGYAEWHPGQEPEEVIEAADKSLYAAKSIGKNMVYGGPVRDLPTLALVETGHYERGSADPMTVGRIIVDGLRCEPIAVEIEPSAPLAGGLLATLEMADPDTRRHSERAMWFALSFAERLVQLGWGLGHNDFRALAYGALLHDIGKIMIPASILRSSRPLDRLEREQVNAHPILGADIISPYRALVESLDVIRSHHERWDGQGYPLGLKGEEIPLTARIFCLIDVMDAMGSNRSYKPALDWDQVVTEIRKQKGALFDPDLVEPFLEIPKEHWDSLRRTQYRIVAPLAHK